MLRDIITSGRLSRYKITDTDDEQVILARYSWNIAISEALYPTLSILEVTLRNRMDDAFVNHIASDWLEPNSKFWCGKMGQECRKLIETRNFMATGTNRGHLVAELTFGFWIGLFKNEYKPLIWNRRNVFDTVFPHCSLKGTDRVSGIRPKLRIARILRNRVSHHEAVFDMPKLGKTVQDIQHVIEWLSPEATKLLSSVDRFEEVYKTGCQPYQ